MSHDSTSPRLLSRLKISKPIIQAPMAGVATPALAAAVTNAGALGSLGFGAMTIEDAREAIRQTRALTDGPFNVNFFCHAPACANKQVEEQWLKWLAPHFSEFGAEPPTSLREIYMSFSANPLMLKMLLEEKPAVVSFHFGLPSREVMRALSDAGVVLMATATNVNEAIAAANAGADAVIAQGIEAGGHRGVVGVHAFDEGLGTLALTRAIVRRVSVPVIAAGGIMDGQSIAAVLMLGAQAAQMGTAFVVCPESSADDVHRRAILAPDGVQTMLTSAISGRLARSIVNRFTELGRNTDRPVTPDYPVAYDAAKALHAAAKAKGEQGYGAYWAGQNAFLARSMPAAELVETLEREMLCALGEHVNM